MHSYLIENMPAEQDIYFWGQNTRKLEIVFHDKFILLITEYNF